MSAPAFDPTLPPEAAGIECPLCDYDLRGLVEPRCPECGYAFDWLELTDPGRRRHKYIFEHHAERNLWSFASTMLGHARPRAFWTGLLPSQPSNPRRLLLYAVLILLSAAPFIAMHMLATAEARRAFIGTRRITTTTWWWYGADGPSTTFAGALLHPFKRVVTGDVFRAYGLVLLWPMLTIAALMIFVVSMRRARIRRVHFLRCVVYSADVFAWPNLMFGLALGYSLTSYLLLDRPIGNFGTIWACTLAAAIPIFVYRLCVAFKRYLRFDHPVATVLATQVIACLSIILIVLILC